MTREEALEVLAVAWLYLMNNYGKHPVPLKALEWAKLQAPQDSNQAVKIDEAMITLFGDPIFSKKQ